METIKYILLLMGGSGTILFLLGMVFTAFHSEPIPDYIEEALEEVTRKRGRKK